MTRQNVEGNLYVGHIEPKLAHAGHYIGWTERDVQLRWNDHETGRGSPLIRAALAAGSTVTWCSLGRGTRHDERRMHNMKRGSRICPVCKAARRAEKGVA